MSRSAFPRVLVPALVFALGLTLSACGDSGGGDGGSTGPDPSAVASVQVTPGSATIKGGATIQLQGLALNSQGGQVSGVTLSWSSNNAGVATVDNTGLVTGVSEGSATITASVSGRSGTASIQVEPGLTVVVESLPSGIVGIPYSTTLNADNGEGTLTWSVAGGALPPGLGLSGSGEISGTPTEAGTFSFTASVTDGSQTATGSLALVVNEPGGPVSLGNRIFMGSAYIGIPYSFQPQVSGGTGVYTFSVSEGTLPEGLTLNSETGEISGTPVRAQVEFFRLSVVSGDESDRRSLSLAVSARPPSEFNLTIFNVANDAPSERILNSLSEVVARYEELIIGDLPGGTFGLTEDLPSCNGRGSLMRGATVDDMTILVNIGPIDGPSNVIGFAAPCELVANTETEQPVTTFGHLTLDDADLDRLDDGQLFGLIWHEIAHIVGIGSLWRTGQQPPGFDLLEQSGSLNRYIGTNAVREFQGLGGTTDYIVVEPQIAGHWDEAAYDYELMTPTIEAAGVAMPISAFTVGSFQDMSYEADPSLADAYELPAGAPGRTAEQRAGGLDLSGDILRELMRFRSRDGSVVWVVPAPGIDGSER